MNSSDFDRLARFVARRVSRRGLLAAAAGLAIVQRRPVLASQLTPPTCGASGAVCTMLVGCCDGLTCVTSAINTNYGVCVPGEGGTVSIGTTLISPFSEQAVQEVAALAQSAETSDTTTPTTTTTTTTTETEREARIEAQELRKETRLNDKKLRKETQKDRKETQNDVQLDRRDDRRDARALRRGPRLKLELLNPGGGVDRTETLRARNFSDSSIVLDKIESLLNPSENTDLNHSLGVGERFSLYSGPVGDVSDDDEQAWRQDPVCTTSAGNGAGFRLYTSFSATSRVHEYEVFCDDPPNGSGNNGSRRKNRRRRERRGRNGGKSRNGTS